MTAAVLARFIPDWQRLAISHAEARLTFALPSGLIADGHERSLAGPPCAWSRPGGGGREA
jgi:hypothetical protein